MLIFGWGFKTVKRYGVISKSKCKICNVKTNWQLVKVTTWFTLFFIPIIPTSIKRMIVCTRCNGGRIVDKGTFEKLMTSIKNGSHHDDTDELQYHNKTEIQKNYLKEMEEYRKEKASKTNPTEKKKKSEEDIIKSTSKPNTRTSLAKQFQEMGLKKGMTIIVHASMSRIGWISGGPVAVIQALMDVITSDGTIIMPAHTGDYSDPTNWENPPVPKDWIEVIKENMPAFDENITPTTGMGRIAEVFRSFPGVVRSSHPQVSFTAWGKLAEEITNNHTLDYGLGEGSPLKKIYDLDGKILLLGVGYNNNTSFHLAEYMINKRKEIKTQAPIFVNEQREWVEYKDIDLDVDDFNRIGTALEEQEKVVTFNIGSAESKLLSQKGAVDFAKEWMEKNRE